MKHFQAVDLLASTPMFGASNENPLKNHESRNIFAAKGGKQSKLPSKDRKHVTKACEPCKGARAKVREFLE